MHRTLYLAATVLLGACAAAKPAEVPSPAATPVPQKEDELAQAFEERPLPEPAATPKVRPPPPLPDPFADFKAALAEGTKALAAKKLDLADSRLGDAVRLAEELTGEERLQAHEAATRVALASGDAARALEAVERWHRACGPERAEACRTAATAAGLKVAALPGAPAKKLKASHEARAKAEDCVAKAARSTTAPKCVAEAERTAKSVSDKLLLSRIALMRALAEKNPAKQAAALERTVASCDEVQCAEPRRKALALLVAKDLEKKNVDGALRHALTDLKVHLAQVPEPLRAWSRPPELDAVCAKVDQAKGAGACRRAEKAAVGRWTFKDYSRQKGGEGLSVSVVKEVNEHYAPLVQECLLEQARRLTPPDAQRYEVRWLVFNDGRAGELHLRADLDQSDLAKCLRTQALVWRYPRYEGEWQNVEQSYTVTASERRL